MTSHEARRQEVIPANRHELDILLQGYDICARAEAKSPKTIKLTSSIVMLFRDFLIAHGLTGDATRIGVPEIRQFIIYLQATPAYSTHPHTRARNRPLAGTTVNGHLLVKEVAPDNEYDEKQGKIARFVDPLNRKQFSYMDPLKAAADAKGIPFEEYLVQVGVVDGMIKEFEKVKTKYSNSKAS